jgi:glycosyltransferase involved in cell wall biosynthesis
VDRDHIDVVYSGRDPLVGSESVVQDETPSLVVLGRLVPHKRVELAISAVTVLREQHPGIVLSVIGHGYWLPELESYAAAIGATPQVRFLGFVDEDVKNRVLAASWLNLLPSVKEGWGLAIIEAAAHGVPSVAFREASGTTESIIDGTTGLLVEDEADFVETISELLTDRVRRQDMGAKAKTFSEQFTWQATTDEVERLLRAPSGVPLDQPPS